LYLSRKLRNTLPQPASEMIIWFRACQSGDGGFGFLPRTTSFVENCYTCLRTLVFLNSAPLYPDRAFQFLARAQTTTGGFGRSSRAVAFLYSTWHALAALAILENGARNLENSSRES
jgi:prenyltransferase beta subunit